MESRSSSLPDEGSVIANKYRVVRRIGVGGMGAVFEAEHLRLRRRVAIKMLLPEMLREREIVERFEREARAAGQLQHRNSGRVIDVDVDDGVPFIVMEFLVGRDLAKELESRGRLPWGEAVAHLLAVCAAMTEAHALGIVHRDLKPSNLFLSQEADGSTCVKVLDFGISKIATEDGKLTATAAQMGTPLYMSPEQVQSAKHVDHRSDIWSMGIILYELVTGAPPFNGSIAGVGAQIVAAQPRAPREIVRGLPPPLEAAIMRAIEKDPARRFASMRDFADAIAPFSSDIVARNDFIRSNPPPALTPSGGVPLPGFTPSGGVPLPGFTPSGGIPHISPSGAQIVIAPAGGAPQSTPSLVHGATEVSSRPGTAIASAAATPSSTKRPLSFLVAIALGSALVVGAIGMVVVKVTSPSNAIVPAEPLARPTVAPTQTTPIASQQLPPVLPAVGTPPSPSIAAPPSTKGRGSGTSHPPPPPSSGNPARL